MLGQLSRRVGDLEERVRTLVQLSGLENAPEHPDAAHQKKKNRRRFTELVRDHEVVLGGCSASSAANATARIRR